MTIRELISRLLDFDPELIVYVGKGVGPAAVVRDNNDGKYVILETRHDEH